MRTWTRAAGWLVLTGVLGLTAVAVAGRTDVLLDALLQRPAASGTVIVPDRYLRSWDPLTVFYGAARGPADGGPEDDPARLVTVEPEHPGAWTWLDSRTLQFRPAEPWPALSVVTARVDGASTDLFTLMSPPRSTTPRDGATGLEAVRTVTIVLPEPIAPDALAARARIELRPLPGLGDDGLRVLDRADFEVKALDRTSTDDPATYSFVLRDPIPLGTRATVRLALSLDDAAAEAVHRFEFRTAEPFRPTHLGCPGRTLPVGSEGTVYPEDQPLRCTSKRAVRVEFTAPLGTVGPVEARNLLRFEPAVANLKVSTSGRRLEVTGDFARETPYTVRLVPTALRDRSGRPLELTGASAVHVYFARKDPYLRWTAGQGILERRGPQRVPVEGRGHGQLDLRIYRVDPMSRELWPWPSGPVAIDESARPPGPGERPEPWTGTSPIGVSGLRERLAALGSPGISTPVDLPLAPEAGAATFGLDLAPHLRKLAGRVRAGHYLVGLRRLDGGTERQWMRVQVTDLALTTIETGREVRFLVTSISSGAPVPGARVRLEAAVREDGKTTWSTVVDAETDAAGQIAWEAPGAVKGRSVTVRRIAVAKGDDVLVLDPSRPPDRYRDGHWHEGDGTWLGWAFGNLTGRTEQAQALGHLFTERPVYRPEEDVHLKGYVRNRLQGRLTADKRAGHVVIEAPGGAEWRLPVEVTGLGSFYARWSESEIPTGTYDAWFEPRGGGRLGQMSFEVEAYRLPTFEVDVDAAGGERLVPNDRPFEATVAASYYAGGAVAARPVRWQVTQYPYTWTPDGLPEGFAYSSDGRYARSSRFDATPALRREATTDRTGGAALVLDPAIEPTAQPRTYVIEATVTGADDQTVTAVHRVHAVPALVLGLKVPRYLDDARAIPASFVVAGPDGAPLAGQDVTVRVIHRQWHSVLRSSDFSDGVARYTTDVVDVPLSEQQVKSGGSPSDLKLPIDEPGVYIVELEARDRLGRAQVVRVDLYAGGDGDVTWSKPESGVFELSLDAPSYVPGDTANLVVRSPFRTGQALVVLELPDGNEYRSVPVRGGKASVAIPVEPGWVPRLPVHVLLRRGRRDAPEVAGAADLGKPQTVGSTAWLKVRPKENTVDVSLAHPAKAMPGETVPVTVTLADPDGDPVAGEVTLWLVDQAVLALGTEQRLDPKPDFITRRETRLDVHDTRNLAFGRLPFADLPGGDGGEPGEDVLENTTIRKDFKPVPYFEPRLMVDETGTATVQVKLPDNLTVFKLRAKAISGEERFGVGTGSLRVRLPVVVQPDLPRFVRPGDALEVAALGRVVEGSGGDGTAEVQVEGLTLDGDAKAPLAWDDAEATRVAWPVTVPTPPAREGGALSRDEVVVRIGARRRSDGAADALEARLPLVDDRRPLHERLIADLAVGGVVEVPALSEPARPGSVRRAVVLADHPGLVKMAAALDVSVSRPARSTGQRLARARAFLGLGALRGPLGLPEGSELVDQAVADALSWLPGVVDSRGLVSAWPGGRGSVSLAAESLQFLVEASEAGYPVNPRLRDRLLRALESGLRSDYRYFIDGEVWLERTRSLAALYTAGRSPDAYLSELSRNARVLGPEGRGRVLLAAARAGKSDAGPAVALADAIEKDVIVRLVSGEERYGGIQSWGNARNPRILPNEARALATMTRALARARPDAERLPFMVDALVTLGGEDGWGDALADAEAMLALGERLRSSGGPPVEVRVVEDGRESAIATSAERAAVLSTSAHEGVTALHHDGGPAGVVFATTRFVPRAPGSEQAAAQHGFVVERTWSVVPEDGPARRVGLDAAGSSLTVPLGAVVEHHVRVVNPEPRAYVAVEVPLAAGTEPLNPSLATAPPEARPTGRDTRSPTWAQFADDGVTYFFEELPKGTFDFYFRTRATTAGRFVQPAAVAELVYDPAVWGGSPGASVVVEAR